MEVGSEAYASDPTTWASPALEAQIAITALMVSQEKGGNVEAICRALNLLLVAGGRSGRMRDPSNLQITVQDLRLHMYHGDPQPDQLVSFTPSPIMAKIIRGDRNGRRG